MLDLYCAPPIVLLGVLCKSNKTRSPFSHRNEAIYNLRTIDTDRVVLGFLLRFLETRSFSVDGILMNELIMVLNYY